ncbi:MAG: Ig domain-containing protein [Myxococcota bacterium]
MWRILFVLLVVACGGSARNADDVTSTDPDALLGGNQIMPVGVVGQPYEASVSASGGLPPVFFEVALENRLPLGLTLFSDGSISGTPFEAGSHTVQILARDAAGQTQRFLAIFEIGLDPTVLACGDRLAGKFTTNAMSATGPVWGAVLTENLQWLSIPWPQGDNQRVEVTLDAPRTAALFVQRPNQLPGSINWQDDYVAVYFGSGAEQVLTIDPSTLPSLSQYAAQGQIPLLLVTLGSGPYQLDVTCSDGPVFRQALPLPVRLGDEFVVDFEVYGDNSTVTFDFEGELPEWVDVDNATGTLSGTALEEISVPLVVTATTVDDRSRSIDSLFAVFEPKPIGCDEAITFATEEAYFDGPVGSFYDPAGYQVYEFEVPTDVSAIDWTLEAGDGQYLGLVLPDEDRFLYFGGAQTEFSGTEPVRIEVTPRTYPAIKHYRESGSMYMVAARTSTPGEMTLTTKCDRGPRPNLAGLPVVIPLSSIDERLAGIGGLPPYSFSATGLPAGLSIEDDRLVGNGTGVGTFPVDLTITDANGASFTDAYDLWLGLDEACDGGEIVECGDFIDGEFTSTLGYGDTFGSSRRLCFYDPSAVAVGFEVTSIDGELALDVSDPGVPGATFIADGRNTFAGTVLREDVEAVALNAFSWPALPDYDGLPVHFQLRSLEAGEWTVAIACDGAVP